MTARHRKLYRASLPWLSAIGLVVLWELVCVVFQVPESILATPTATLKALIQYREAIWLNAGQTLFTTLIGFGLAIVFGLALGVAIGAAPLLYRALGPLLIGFNAIPKVALVPILVMWFGIGTVPAIITAFLISFFPIAVNVAAGIATLEPELQDVLRSLGARKRDILWKVGLPRALPYFFASLKVAISLAFVGSVISETVASNEGIGHLMLVASSSFRTPLLFAGLVVIAVLGIIMYAVAALMERRLAHWATRGTDGGLHGGG